MILTCPKCASRFMLAAQILAPDGKRVKCSSCEETWFELPDPDELLEELEKEETGEVAPLEDIPEDIPDSVKPIPEGSSVPAIADDSPQDSPKEKAEMRVVILSALLMFLVLIAPLIVLKGTIIKAWPESIAFYSKLGMAGALPGEGVVFDQMRAEIKDNQFILTGQVINLTSHDSALPLIEVTLKDEEGHDISHYYIKLPKDILDAEETLPIKAEYEVEEISKVFDASIRFVLKARHKSKTASKDGDNTPAPHGDENHHPPVDAKSSKSPAHDDAQPHPEPSHDSPSDHH